MTGNDIPENSTTIALWPTKRSMRLGPLARTQTVDAMRRALANFSDIRSIVHLEPVDASSSERSSLLGLNAALSVTVYGCTVAVIGHPRLLESAHGKLSNHRFTERAERRLVYQLARRTEIWTFLRQLLSGIAVRKRHRGINLSLFGNLSYETVAQRLSDEPDVTLTLYRTVIAMDETTARFTHYRFAGDDGVDVAALVRVCASALDEEAKGARA